MQDQSDDKMPDRPLECFECKKPIKIQYTEINGKIITRTSMCADCPELQRRLYGHHAVNLGQSTANLTGIACGNCGTTLEEVKRGHRLGCMECYEVFGDVILTELQLLKKLPAHLIIEKKSQALHIGTAPGEIVTINPSSQLLALNEALKETLHREDYEQAALLRDQIKALTQDQIHQDEKEKKQTSDPSPQDREQMNEGDPS